MLDLAAIAPRLQKDGIWGPVTATLDWCEINYQFSPYVAEMANTLSNLFSIALALHGLLEVQREHLPKRYAAGYLGVMLVGAGSLAFHATLLFGAQLADELPMVYVGSFSLYLLFDDRPGFKLTSKRSRVLIFILGSFDILFTWTYYLSRNPVYHQVVFASIVLSTVFRVAYLLRKSTASHRIPDKTKAVITRVFGIGAGLFALGFFIWNLDNIFCRNLIRRKIRVGWPLAFLLEGHSWWHVLTGSGSYFMFIGIQYVTLCIKDNSENYTVTYNCGLPHVRRVRRKVLNNENSLMFVEQRPL